MIIGLNGIIQGGVSVKDFSAVTKINPIDSKIILYFKRNYFILNNHLIIIMEAI